MRTYLRGGPEEMECQLLSWLSNRKGSAEISFIHQIVINGWFQLLGLAVERTVGPEESAGGYLWHVINYLQQ